MMNWIPIQASVRRVVAGLLDSKCWDKRHCDGVLDNVSSDRDTFIILLIIVSLHSLWPSVRGSSCVISRLFKI